MKLIENVSVGAATMSLFVLLCGVVYGVWELIFKVLNYYGIFNVLTAVFYTILGTIFTIAFITLLYEMGDNVNRLLVKKYRVNK